MRNRFLTPNPNYTIQLPSSISSRNCHISLPSFQSNNLSRLRSNISLKSVFYILNLQSILIHLLSLFLSPSPSSSLFLPRIKSPLLQPIHPCLLFHFPDKDQSSFAHIPDESPIELLHDQS